MYDMKRLMWVFIIALAGLCIPVSALIFGSQGSTGVADVTWADIDKTTSDIADITTKSHTSLDDIGTNTHAQIDTHIADSDIHADHTSINIDTGTGLTGGGDITTTRTISIKHLGLENLTDPADDRILGWDDTDNNFSFFVIGENLTYDQASNTLTASGGGGAGATSPAGNDKEIQYNDGGSFGASSDFKYDDTTKSLNISNSGGASYIDIIGGSSGGDAYIKFREASEGTVWSLGGDDTGQTFRISENDGLGTNDRFVIEEGGDVVVGSKADADAPFEIFSTTTPQFRITETDDTDYFEISVDSNGNVDMDASGSSVSINHDLSIGGEGSDGNSQNLKIEAQSDTWFVAVMNEATAAATDFFIGLAGEEDGIFHITQDTHNVLIGTATDSGDKFLIDGGAAAVNQHIRTGGSNCDSFIVFEEDVETAFWSLGLDDTGNSFRISEGDGLGTNDRFVIEEGGNIGIGGVTDPVGRFDINTSTSSEIYFTGDKNANIIAETGLDFYWGTADATNFYIYTNDDTSTPTPDIYIQSDGNISLGGCTDPDHDFVIGGSGSGCDTGTYSEIDAGESTFDTSSSSEFKENIIQVNNEVTLTDINKLKVVEYDYKPEHCSRTIHKIETLLNTTDYDTVKNYIIDNNIEADASCLDKKGLLAEDVYDVTNYGSPTSYNAQNVIDFLVQYNQKLAEEITALKLEIALLKSK